MHSVTTAVACSATLCVAYSAAVNVLSALSAMVCAAWRLVSRAYKHTVACMMKSAITGKVAVAFSAADV
jgi:hypothetical protein